MSRFNLVIRLRSIAENGRMHSGPVGRGRRTGAGAGRRTGLGGGGIVLGPQPQRDQREGIELAAGFDLLVRLEAFQGVHRTLAPGAVGLFRLQVTFGRQRVLDLPVTVRRGSELPGPPCRGARRGPFFPPCALSCRSRCAVVAVRCAGAPVLAVVPLAGAFRVPTVFFAVVRLLAAGVCFRAGCAGCAPQARNTKPSMAPQARICCIVNLPSLAIKGTAPRRRPGAACRGER